MKTIESIKYVWEQDDHGEPDYLETTAEEHYGTNGANWLHLSPEERAKVEAEHGSIGGACEHYAREDAARLEAFRRGDWRMEGCYAVAKVWVNGTLQKVRTPGLWGIESDSDEGYKREVEEEQREELLDLLDSLDFDTMEYRAKVAA